jgi:predicted ArsR family transcriptional regulator
MSQDELDALRKQFVHMQQQDQIDLFRLLVEKYGTGILDVVAEKVRHDAQERFEQADIPTRDLNTIHEMLWKNLSEAFAYTKDEHTPTRLRYTLTRCPYADFFVEQNAGEIGFAFYCNYDYGFCQGFNPDLKFTRTKTLMTGDDCCDHTYELKA